MLPVFEVFVTFTVYVTSSLPSTPELQDVLSPELWLVVQYLLTVIEGVWTRTGNRMVSQLHFDLSAGTALMFQDCCPLGAVH